VRPIRVMTVDDSVVVRLMVAEALRGEPDFELAGFAQNGQIALDKLDSIRPDVIVLDVEMPVLDGLATLAQLRKIDRRLPVVMFSTLTSRGASATVEALTLGAGDYVQKPSAASRDESLEVLRRELLPKLRALGGRRRDGDAPLAGAPPLPSPRSLPLSTSRSGPVDVVVLGISTGGPNALADMLPGLPGDLAAPVLVVQHMPPLFTAMLAKRLDALTPLTVREAQGGEHPRAGEVWIAPGGRHMVVERGPQGPVLVLNDDPQVNSCRPAVDPLFSSAVKTYGGKVLAVVMTGMGKDGLNGCRDVHQAQGQVVVQDEDSCVVWGMPRFVTEAGIAHAIVPLERIAAEISRRVPSRLVHA
jgi:two-component system chemotaxis response regulator CheB